MDKGDPVRKTKTHKPAIVLPMAALLMSHRERKEKQSSFTKGFSGPGTKKNYHKGAFGKCKYLIVKEKWLEQTRQSRSAKRVSSEEGHGGLTATEQSVALAPGNSSVEGNKKV